MKYKIYFDKAEAAGRKSHVGPEYVEAERLEIENGVLIFKDHFGDIIEAYAVGRWKNVEKLED